MNKLDKESRTVILNLRISKSDKLKAIKLAAEKEVTLSQLIRGLLKEA
jgi:hypothetical protein